MSYRIENAPKAKTFGVTSDEYLFKAFSRHKAFDTRSTVTSDLIQIVIEETLEYCAKLPKSFGAHYEWKDDFNIMAEFYLQHLPTLLEKIKSRCYHNSELSQEDWID